MTNINLRDSAEGASSVIQKYLPKAIVRKGLPPRASKCSFLHAWPLDIPNLPGARDPYPRGAPTIPKGMIKLGMISTPIAWEEAIWQAL